MPHCAPSLSSLPPELIEEIIIFSTLFGDTRTPSTLAQTCRRLRTVIYHQMNKHLWREMFLILFDDPRPALDLHAQGRAPQPQQINSTNKGKGKSKDCLSSHDYSWEDEYKLRIWAESFILKRTRPPSEPPSPHDASSDLPSTDAELYTLLDTLLRVVLTAAPLPDDELAILTSHCHMPNLSEPFPILSPLSLAAHTLPALVWGSRNTSWLARVLAHGLPPVLMSRLSAFDKNGEIYIQKKPVKWDGLLVKLVAQVGLMMPITNTTCCGERPDDPQVEHDDGDDLHVALDQEDDSDFEPQLEGEGEGEGDEERERDTDGDEAPGTPATTLKENVRRLARLRIFNMSYLHPSRAFGPFLPLEMHYPSYSSPSAPNSVSGTVPEEEEVSLDNTMRLESTSSTAVPPVLPIPDTHLDLASYDLSPVLDDAGQNNDNDETSRDGNLPTNDAPDPVISSVYPIEAISGAPAMYPPDIPGRQLPHFDWAWIAAARLVIELNLRDLLSMERHQSVLRAFLSLHGLRSRSAPVFPAAPPEAVAAGKGEDEGGWTFKDGEGWDWAGVEGQWRRFFCWLDYRDLVANNTIPLAERFSDSGSNDMMRIVLMTLRITHYSRAHALWPGRPKIHFNGELHVGFTEANPGDLGVRLLQGTVQMAASGDVRWSHTSYTEDGKHPFITEGVQIGGISSAMGVIGLWASADQGGSAPVHSGHGKLARQKFHEAPVRLAAPPVFSQALVDALVEMRREVGDVGGAIWGLTDLRKTS